MPKTIRLRVAIAVLLAVSASQALAQGPLPLPFPPLPFPGFQGTPEEQRACRPDVIRLCKGVPSDAMPMLNCLQRNRPQLSDACRGVLQRHGV